MLAIEVRSQVREARNRVVYARAAVDYYRTVLLPLRERIVALGGTFEASSTPGQGTVIVATAPLQEKTA